MWTRSRCKETKYATRSPGNSCIESRGVFNVHRPPRDPPIPPTQLRFPPKDRFKPASFVEHCNSKLCQTNMKKLLVLQHVAHELLGTLNPLLKSAGFRLRYVNFARHLEAQPSLDGYHGLVVLGGPMSGDDTDRLPHLMTEMKLIEAAMRRDLPVLGICLGAQLIAKTLGAA